MEAKRILERLGEAMDMFSFTLQAAKTYATEDRQNIPSGD
jgi:hypothetical protein